MLLVLDWTEAVTQTIHIPKCICSRKHNRKHNESTTKTQHVPAVLRTTAVVTTTALGGEELAGATELLGLCGRMHVHDLDHALR